MPAVLLVHKIIYDAVKGIVVIKRGSSEEALVNIKGSESSDFYSYSFEDGSSLVINTYPPLNFELRPGRVYVLFPPTYRMCMIKQLKKFPVGGALLVVLGVTTSTHIAGLCAPDLSHSYHIFPDGRVERVNSVVQKALEKLSPEDFIEALEKNIGSFSMRDCVSMMNILIRRLSELSESEEQKHIL